MKNCSKKWYCIILTIAEQCYSEMPKSFRKRETNEIIRRFQHLNGPREMPKTRS